MNLANLHSCVRCQKTLCILLAALAVIAIIVAGGYIALFFDFDPQFGIFAALLILIVFSIFISHPRHISAEKRKKMVGEIIVHYTSSKNKDSIERQQGKSKIVILLPSKGYQNILNWIFIGNCSFLFLKEPNNFIYYINICGRDRQSESAKVVIRAEDLPKRTYLRIWDGAILIPGGYCGPGEFVSHAD